MHPLRLSLFALLLLAVLGMSQEAEAGLVEVYIDDVDLGNAEDVVTIESETDFEIIIRLAGVYRLDSGNDTFSVYSIWIDIHFLSDDDPRDSCTPCAIPAYQPLGDTEDDPGYDEFRAGFHSDSTIFEGYSGAFQISMIMKNQTGEIIRDEVFDLVMFQKDKPDLYLSQIIFDNANPEIGDVVKISTIIKVLKMNVTDNFSVTFYLDSISNTTIIGTVEVGKDDLVWGIENQHFVSVNWTAINGTHTIYAVVDSTDVIDESEEKNDVSDVITVGFVEPEPEETPDTTEETTTGQDESSVTEDEPEPDYTTTIIGAAVLVALSILGAAVILRR